MTGTDPVDDLDADLGALANLRDAGAVLRPGVLYRSEAPQPGDRPPPDLAWPPATVLDLREPDELDGPHPLAGPATTIVPLPMMAALEPDRVREDVDLADRYVAGVRQGARWFPALLATAADAPGPILVHCAAGKDRTGIAVAILLRLAGAPRDAVLADFLATAPALDAVHRRLARADPDRQVAPGVSAVRRDAMEDVLDALGEPADARALVLQAGVAEADLTAWRARLTP